MEIGRIEDLTRELGKSQGYLGLPIKDVVLSCNVGGEKTRAMQSAWLPTSKEIDAIKNGAPIILTLHGTQHPPVMIEVGAIPTDKVDN